VRGPDWQVGDFVVSFLFSSVVPMHEMARLVNEEDFVL